MERPWSPGKPPRAARRRTMKVFFGKTAILGRAAAVVMVLLLTAEIGLSAVYLFGAPRVEDGPLAFVCRLADAICCAILIVIYFVRRQPVRTTRHVLPNLTAIVGFLSPISFVVLPRVGSSSPLLLLSSGCFLVGTVAATIAICWLGRSFSVLPQARALITDGPYRYVRHPIYLSELFAISGSLWQFEQPAASAFMLAVAGLQIARIHFEERILRKAFPEYGAYATRTARLLPGLY